MQREVAQGETQENVFLQPRPVPFQAPPFAKRAFWGPLAFESIWLLVPRASGSNSLHTGNFELLDW